MSRTIAATMCLLLLVAPSSSRPGRTSPFDRFYFTDCESLTARLDNFAFEMTYSPGLQTKGLVMVYGGKEVEKGETQLYIDRIKSYLIGRRGVEARRLNVTFMGYREEAGADIWIVPPDVSLQPEPMRTLELKDVVFKKKHFKASRFDCAKGPWPK